MQSINNIIVVIEIVIAVAAIIFIIIPLIRIIFPYNSQTRETKELRNNLKLFLNTRQSSDGFIWLLKKGAFPCLVTGNHGGDFPDEKQCENFKKYATSEVCDKIFSIEVSNEKFII